MPQNNITILCTKAIDEALIEDAASKNIVVDASPFIRTEYISSIETSQQIEHALELSGTVVFTSVNAVTAVAAQLGEQKPEWRIFCIGHATRQSAEKYFGKDSISGTADNAKELAVVIVNANINEVIFFCGDHRRNELPDWLRKKNIEIHEIVVYHVMATPHKIEKKYNAIVFFSPSAVQSFFQTNQLDDQVVLFAIGSTTANEIRKYLPAGGAGSKNKIIVGGVPDKKDLFGKMSRYFQTHPVHH